MRRVENDCVGCEYCIHCGNKQALHFYCDGCGQDSDPEELYDYDGEELCSECLLSQFDKIRV